ncbi:hypothetical protein F6X40_24055 [Paraburkholderia sp. UCT31]|uniref:hypothetical protein n=1 Tax=Paraburkholderia sp. UCT31 TaxID=2615209 RepID=UPI001655739D|nr:hypothetical protein [Paraburkholderia sp. UCT31]MBC8739791.1 hypothetical protein [Paraburkholderia sp. UCT31]
MQTVSFELLYHIGSFDPRAKGSQFSKSHEGHGLSVSEYPDAWRQIARLGGQPLWRLSKRGNQFLDYHALSNDERLLIRAWGVEKGWVVHKTVWTVEYYDSEAEDSRVMYCRSEDEAKKEAGFPLGEDEAKIATREIVAATEKLAEFVGFMPDDMMAEHLLAVAYAETILLVDGVFWDDELAPLSYSAPRAVIFPARLPSWTVVNVSDDYP